MMITNLINLLKSKKGEAHHYAGMLIAFILGAVLVFLMAKGTIPVPIDICNCAKP